MQRIAACLLLTFVLCATDSVAQTVTWTGAGENNSWNNPANWDPAVVPGPEHDAVISTHEGFVRVLEASSVGSVTFDGEFAVLELNAELTVLGDYRQTHPSSTLRGGGDLIVDGTLHWSAGRMEASGLLLGKVGGSAAFGNTVVNGRLEITGDEDDPSTEKSLEGRTFVITDGATGVLSGSRDLEATWGSGIEIESGGRFEIDGDIGLDVDFSGGDDFLAIPTVTNAGSFVKADGDGESPITWTISNEGIVESALGTLALLGDVEGAAGTYRALVEAVLEFRNMEDATFSFSMPSTIEGDGTIKFSFGTWIVEGTYDVSGTTEISGTPDGGGTLQFNSYAQIDNLAGTLLHVHDSGALVAQNPLALTTGEVILADQGSIDLTSTLHVTGDFSQQGMSSIFESSADLTVGGLLTWSGGTMRGAGSTEARGGGLLTGDDVEMNQKLLDDGRRLVIPDGADMEYVGSAHLVGGDNTSIEVQSGGTLDFQRQMNLSVQEGTDFAPTILNEGMILRSAGEPFTIVLWETTNDGTVRSKEGGIAFAADFVNTTDGRIEGVASIAFGEAVLTNEGAVAPGIDGAGLLTFGSPYHNGSVLEIELAGPTPGAEHDVLAVEGSADLAGTVHVTPINDFIPSSGDRFTILEADAISGTFDEVTTTWLPDGLSYELEYGENSVDLVVVGSDDEANTPPLAEDDAYDVDEGETLTVLEGAEGVLANDTDENDDPLTAELLDSVDQGDLEFNGDGTFTYHPNDGFSGTDSFVYEAWDGEASSGPATVTITVHPANSPPNARADRYAGAEDDVIRIEDAAEGVLANDSDPDEDRLEAELVTGPEHGTLEFAEDGTFTYAPQPNYFGDDRFTYRALDGSGRSDEADVRLVIEPVNDLPEIADDAYETDEDTPLEPRESVLANDTDVDGDELTAVLVEDATHGALEFSPDGTFSYQPDRNFNGRDSFIYAADDGSGAEDLPQGEVVVAVNPVNDPPEIVSRPPTDARQEDEYTYQIEVVDPDDEELRFDLPGAPDWLNLRTDGGQSATLTGTPTSHDIGRHKVAVVVSDGEAEDEQRFIIEVENVNDPPQAKEDRYTVEQGEILRVDAFDGVVRNDVDPDGDRLTAELVREPENGTVRVENDGAFTYEPDPRFDGEDAFLYRVSDPDGLADTAAVHIYVRNANTAPTAQRDVFEVAEDEALDVPAEEGVLANDTDPDDEALRAELITGPEHGTLELLQNGSFSYTPDADFFGEDGFTYRAIDSFGERDEATAAIMVRAVNDPPVFASEPTTRIEQDQRYSYEVLVEDIDDEEIAISAESLPQWLRLEDSGDGSAVLAGTPGPQDVGDHEVTLHADDGTDAATQEFVIAVADVNDPPIVENDAYRIEEDATLDVLAGEGVLANDTDPDGDELAAELLEDVANGTLELQSDGSFTYEPNPDFFGQDTFVYAADDGSGDIAVGTVVITVDPVNDPPAFISEPVTAAQQGSAYRYVTEAADPDDDDLTIATTELPDWLQFEERGNGTAVLSGTPAQDDIGEHGVALTVSDGSLGAEQRFLIDVSNVNDAPVAGDDAYTVEEDETLDVPVGEGVLANDEDPDGDPLEIALIEDVENGTLELQEDGAFTYVPAPDYFGTDGFIYSVSDGSGEPVEASVEIEVRAVNDPPVAAADTAETFLSTPVNVSVLENDTDIDDSALVVAGVSETEAGAAVVINDDNSLTYTPSPSFFGDDVFRYTVADTSGATDEAAVLVTVHAPQFEITDLGSLGGGAMRALALNGDAVVVGAASTSEGLRAFRWADETLEMIDAGNGGTSIAYDVGGSGRAVGFAGPADTTGQAFVATRGGDITLLDGLGGNFSVAYGADGGTVVGTAQTSGPSYSAFEWSGGSMGAISVTGAAHSQAFGIGGGTPVGIIQDDEGTPSAFIGSSVVEERPSRAYDINIGGTAVGSVSSGEQVTAYRWTDGEGEPLETLDGGFSEAFGINDSGWIVGASTFEDVAAKHRALAWHERRGPVDVETLRTPIALGKSQANSVRAGLWIDGRPLDLTDLIADEGWTLLEARDVNSAGQIVGHGIHEGETRAFLLTPMHNEAPSASDVAVHATVDGSATIDVAAADNDGDPLRLLRVGQPENGRAEIEGERQIRYIAAPGFVGTDQFRFVVTDDRGGTAEGLVTVTVDGDPSKRPASPELTSTYPNPFVARTTIEFVLPEDDEVKIRLYDALGQLVRTLDSSRRSAGVHRLDVRAEGLSAGMYFCRLTTSGGTHSRTLTIVR